MFIPVILGTARQGRQSEKVARFMLAEVAKIGLESVMIDVRDYQLIATDNSLASPQAKKLAAIIAKADGLIIVTPEYNHGYPGELKMLLDLLYEQYAKKPLGICGVSAGWLGGARAVEQLRQVCAELHMIDIREALYFSAVQNLFDDNGNIKSPVAQADRVKVFMDELLWYAKALKGPRGDAA